MINIHIGLESIMKRHTGWPICIWTILWGYLEVTGWLKIKKINPSKKFMQIPLKVNKVYFFDIKHGLTMTFRFFFSKSKNYAISKYVYSSNKHVLPCTMNSSFYSQQMAPWRSNFPNPCLWSNLINYWVMVEN